MLIQQGDVLFISRDTMKKSGLKKVKRTSRGYVLAEGEVTGHAHCVESDIDLMLDEASKTLYMRNDEAVTVKHEEHKHVTVPAGNWEVRQVKEYDHFAEEARKVQD